MPGMISTLYGTLIDRSLDEEAIGAIPLMNSAKVYILSSTAYFYLALMFQEPGICAAPSKVCGSKTWMREID